MAIGRTTMTKQMTGNRTKKTAPAGDGGKTMSAALKTAQTPAMKRGGKVKK
jgi:hypothetical protein